MRETKVFKQRSSQLQALTRRTAGEEGLVLRRRFAPPPNPAALASSAFGQRSGQLQVLTRRTAGEEGLEPPVLVLETSGLPLTDSPLNFRLTFSFFMHGVLAAITAKLIDFHFHL